MGLKILHSADWHLDSPFSGVSEAQRQQLRREQLAIPGKIADLCKEENCQLVLLAGDLFDAEPGREAMDTVKAALSRCAVPVFISPGNHDACRPGTPWLEESWPENVTVFTGALESRVVEELDLRIWGAGFTDMDCPSLLEGFRADCREPYTVALLHGDPSQANSPYNPITAAQVRFSGLDYLALGHIHKAGSFRAGATLCGWPGCPMGRGWDETGEKGVYIVNLEPDSAEIRPVMLDTPRFLENTVDISAGAEAALEAVLPPVPSSDFYRITLNGEGSVSLDALQQQFPHIPNLELRDRTEAPLDIWGDESADTLEGTYFRLLREKMDASAPETAARVRMAAEISRRLMEGREVRLP